MPDDPDDDAGAGVGTIPVASGGAAPVTAAAAAADVADTNAVAQPAEAPLAAAAAAEAVPATPAVPAAEMIEPPRAAPASGSGREQEVEPEPHSEPEPETAAESPVQTEQAVAPDAPADAATLQPEAEPAAEPENEAEAEPGAEAEPEEEAEAEAEAEADGSRDGSRRGSVAGGSQAGSRRSSRAGGSQAGSKAGSRRGSVTGSVTGSRRSSVATGSTAQTLRSALSKHPEHEIVTDRRPREAFTRMRQSSAIMVTLLSQFRKDRVHLAWLRTHRWVSSPSHPNHYLLWARCVYDALFAPDLSASPMPEELPTDTPVSAIFEGSKWSGTLCIHLSSAQACDTPYSLIFQQNEDSSSNSFSAIQKMLGDYMPVTVSQLDDQQIQIKSEDGQTVCTGRLTHEQGQPAKLEGTLVRELPDGTIAADWHFTLFKEQPGYASSKLPRMVAPYVARFRNSYKLQEERLAAGSNKDADWERDDVPNQTWEGQLFRSLFVRDAQRLRRLPSSMYNQRDGLGTVTDPSQPSQRETDMEQPKRAKPPTELHLPWSRAEEQNLAMLVHETSYGKLKVGSLEAVVEFMHTKKSYDNKHFRMLMNRGPDEVRDQWASMTERFGWAREMPGAPNTEQILTDLAIKSRTQLKRWDSGNEMRWAAQDPQLEKVETVMRRKMIGPLAGPERWKTLAADFLQLAKSIASRIGQFPYNDPDKASENEKFLVVAAKLRAAMFQNNMADKSFVAKDMDAAKRDMGDLIRSEPAEAISFARYTIGDYGVRILCEDIEQGRRMKELDVSRSQITQVGAAEIFTVLLAHGAVGLEKLAVSGNRIGEGEDAEALQAWINKKKMSGLRPRDLKSKQAKLDRGALGMAQCASLLSSNMLPSLTALHLNRAGIGNIGASMLAASLSRNSTLQELALSHNWIGDTGAFSLADMLGLNKQLRSIALQYNLIGDEGAEAVAESLADNSTLEVLDLDGNGMGAGFAGRITEVFELEQNSSLSRIQFSFGTDGGSWAALTDARIRVLKAIEARLHAPQTPLASPTGARSQRRCCRYHAWGGAGGRGGGELERVHPRPSPSGPATPSHSHAW